MRSHIHVTCRAACFVALTPPPAPAPKARSTNAQPVTHTYSHDTHAHAHAPVPAQPMHLSDAPFPFTLPIFPKTDVYFVKLSGGPVPVPVPVPVSAYPLDHPDSVAASFTLANMGDPPALAQMRDLTLEEWRLMFQGVDAQASLGASFEARQWSLRRPRKTSLDGGGSEHDGGATEDLDGDLIEDDEEDMLGLGLGLVSSSAEDVLPGGSTAKPRNSAPGGGQEVGDMADSEDDEFEYGTKDADDVTVDIRTGLIVNDFGHGVGNEDEMESIDGSEKEEDSAEDEDEDADEEDIGDD